MSLTSGIRLLLSVSGADQPLMRHVILIISGFSWQVPQWLQQWWTRRRGPWWRWADAVAGHCGPRSSTPQMLCRQAPRLLLRRARFWKHIDLSCIDIQSLRDTRMLDASEALQASPPPPFSRAGSLARHPKLSRIGVQSLLDTRMHGVRHLLARLSPAAGEGQRGASDDITTDLHRYIVESRDAHMLGGRHLLWLVEVVRSTSMH